MPRVSRQTTTTALLESLKDPGQDDVWRELDARYRPVLSAMARSAGLGYDDAEDVAQASLVEFVRCYRQGKYDPSRGRLSSWIIAIERNLIAMRLRTKGRARERRGDSAMGDVSNPTDLTQMWAIERERALLARAWEILRTTGRNAERTLRAFELVAMRGTPASAVAEECGMTLDEVYIAKARLTRRLREIAEELAAAYGEDS